MFCNNCGQKQPENARFCSDCGARIVGAIKKEILCKDNKCPECGAAISPDMQECDHCGHSFRAVIEESVPREAIPPQIKYEICLVCKTGNVPGMANCVSCGCPIKDINLLKKKKEKLIAEQQRVKSYLTEEARSVLENDEYIGYLAVGNNGGHFYIVTDRRIIAFQKKGVFTAKHIFMNEVRYDDIISFSDLEQYQATTKAVIEGIAAALNNYYVDVPVQYAFHVNTENGNSQKYIFTSDEFKEGLELLSRLRSYYEVHEKGIVFAEILLCRCDLDDKKEEKAVEEQKDERQEEIVEGNKDVDAAEMTGRWKCGKCGCVNDSFRPTCLQCQACRNENAGMNAKELYEAAHTAHYEDKDISKANKLYDQVISDYPDSPEANYSKTQINNIKNMMKNADN